VRIDAGAAKVCHIPAPRSGLEAKFSLRLTSAMALAGIDTARLDSYSARMAADPPLVSLRDKVSVEFEHQWPHTLAEMRVTLDDGRVVEARYDSGIPAADLAAQQRRLEAKFMTLAEPVVGRSRAEQLVACVAALDGLGSLDELTRLCVPA
jgi:2-methylcitrate dehydratase PrpD